MRPGMRPYPTHKVTSVYFVDGSPLKNADQRFRKRALEYMPRHLAASEALTWADGYGCVIVLTPLPWTKEGVLEVRPIEQRAGA